MEPELLQSISELSRIVYVFADDELIRSGYFKRDHLQGMEGLFPKLSEPERARSETLDVVVKGSHHCLEQAKRQGVRYFIRDASTRKEEMAAEIEKHFQLQ